MEHNYKLRKLKAIVDYIWKLCKKKKSYKKLYTNSGGPRGSHKKSCVPRDPKSGWKTIRHSGGREDVGRCWMQKALLARYSMGAERLGKAEGWRMKWTLREAGCFSQGSFC
jgi:hypothetical protein